jgi:uncharacterized protein (TIGR02302 family)
MSEADPRGSLGFRRRLTLARAAGAIEAVWPALWPSVAFLGLFLLLSLLGVWQRLPAWLHGLGLLGFAVALGWSLWRARTILAWPGPEAGMSRLERVNALSHQPLRSLGDQLSSGEGDPGTRSLWRRHRERLLRSLVGLRVGPPRSDLPRRDPWALRAALLLLLVVGLVEAGPMAPQRLADAFAFGRPGGVTPSPVELTLWITPPTYTGRPPLSLTATPPNPDPEAAAPAATQVSVPAGSEVMAQLHHLAGDAAGHTLSLEGQRQPFAAVGPASAEARLVIEGSGELAVGSTAGPLGAWQIDAIPDQPPEIAFTGQPGATQRGTLRTEFTAEDDYGIVGIALLMSRPESSDTVERMELMRPGSGATAIQDSSYLDLTPHPWAGLPVTLQLQARDGIEQRGWSEPLEVILPERPFQHPVAREIIEQRRQLASDPEQRDEVAAALDRLSRLTDLFGEDPAVFLALQAAASRLAHTGDEAAISDVMELLWDTALHLEDGSLSLAERQLRELQEALRDALADGADAQELERLMSELEQALNEFLDELARQASEMAQNMEEMPLTDPNAMEVRRQDLQQMMDMLREMIETGAHDAARQMLAQLQEMLENLQVAQSQQMQQGQQMLNQLQEMIERQQGLLDETFDMSRQEGQQGQQGEQGMGQQGDQQAQGQQGQGQQGMPGQGRFGEPQQGGQGPGGQLGQLTMDQEALRRALGELMQGIGDAGVPIPRALGEAELSMRAARDALGQGQPDGAIDPQSEAIDQLRQGGQAMLEEMQQMYGQGQGEVLGQQPFGQSPDGRDPLGRSMFNQGGADLWGERVPSELDLGRARAIMEELYRRASERGRPVEELDYLERLLRRF